MIKSTSPSSPVDKKPLSGRGSFDLKDDKSSDNIADLEKMLEVELKILNGAENLLKTVTNKKDKQEVTKKLEESSKKVETLRDKINQLGRKKETKHGQGYSLTDVDDMIDSLNLSKDEIAKKMEWVNEKIKLEMKVKTGAENLAKVYSAQKDKKLMNEVFDKLMDSNMKINLLRVALQKYKRALKDQTGVPEVKDHKFTDEELKHWKRASLTGRLKVKIMGATNLAPHHKKLEAKCLIKVDSKVKGKTSVKKTNAPVWNEDFDIMVEGAGELELHVMDKNDLHAILFFDVAAMNQNDTYFEEKTYEMEPRGFITMSVSFAKRASALNRRERVNRRGAVKSNLPTAFIRFMGYGQSKEISNDLLKEKTQRRRTMKIENKQKQKSEPATPSTPTIRKQPKFEDFALVKVLGKGNFGKVMLVEEKATKNLYAIKVLKKEFVIENDEVESVMSEKRIFQIANKERHPFLVKLHSCFHTDDRIFFVMEYVSGGDLMMHIQRQLFSDSRARLYAAEVLLGLEYFHKNNVVYRDLKLDNILMDLDGHIKIADYGLCKENMPRGSTTNTFCGTPEFMAPEILLEQDYDRAVDWWALGVLIYEMVLAQSPFKGDEEEEIFDSILEGNVHYPSKLAPDTVDIIQKLLERDPKKRLGAGPDDAEEIKRHPYFKSIDWDAVLNKKIPVEFKPTITGALDTSNFDPEFTRETPCLTPLDSVLLEVDQEEFTGFSYAAEWIDHNETFI